MSGRIGENKGQAVWPERLVRLGPHTELGDQRREYATGRKAMACDIPGLAGLFGVDRMPVAGACNFQKDVDLVLTESKISRSVMG